MSHSNGGAKRSPAEPESSIFSERATKRCAFTNHLAAPGFWNDCSMDVENKKIKAKEWSEHRKQKSQYRLYRKFEALTKKVRDIQDALARRQNQMANGALHKYCACKIQTTTRIYFACKRLRSLKAIRFLNDWVVFRLYIRRRYRSGSKIYTHVKNYLCYKRRKEWLRLYEAATTLKRAFCVVMYTRQYKKKLAVRKAVDEAVRHMVLFGFTRAFHSIRYDVQSENTARVMKRLFSSYGRKKRLEMLKGPDGKVAYYYLQYTLVKELGLHSNDLITKIKQWIDHLNITERGTISSRNFTRSRQKVDTKIGPKKFSKSPRTHHMRKATKLSTFTPSPIRNSESSNKFIMDPPKPREFQGIFRPRSIFDVFFMILDCMHVAMENPSLVDGEVPLQLYKIYKCNAHPKMLVTPEAKSVNINSSSRSCDSGNKNIAIVSTRDQRSLVNKKNRRALSFELLTTGDDGHGTVTTTKNGEVKAFKNPRAAKYSGENDRWIGQTHQSDGTFSRFEWSEKLNVTVKTETSIQKSVNITDDIISNDNGCRDKLHKMETGLSDSFNTISSFDSISSFSTPHPPTSIISSESSVKGNCFTGGNKRRKFVGLNRANNVLMGL